MRLDYFIANATKLSRKDAKRAIGKGQVELNDQPCRKASVQVEVKDRITLDGVVLSLPGERYLMLFKPAGVISATTDSQQPTAIDLLPVESRRGLHIAGRLDRDTTGLLLLTTDGQWSHRVTSPRADCHKVYRVGLGEPITETAIEMLEAGVQLRDESSTTRPAGVRVVADQLIELTIGEGRYHQVKRMLAAVGNHVVSLHRIQIGEIKLDTSLAPGEFRELTPEERNSVS
ncbi:pseudouridine synthase [Marinobacter confluentis]|uniref:Pseudouridine synthase n=1 Tax=Marinobacter confluentis TaxID=1697557 RepID=A0A4Z1CFE0_9GAMM|nr:pseudouridine synthase [Marinobacter confluentis]TGN38774.1 pseudouridine synthase [Marinobacter confluentis]